VGGLAAVKRQAPTEESGVGRVSTAVPGSRGHPIRSLLAHAERDNPDGVPASMGAGKADREEG